MCLSQHKKSVPKEQREMTHSEMPLSSLHWLIFSLKLFVFVKWSILGCL